MSRDNNKDELLTFADEINERPYLIEKWKILIIDDSEEIHAITKLALSDLIFKNKSVEFISAYTAFNAKAILNSEEDIALVLLDVVMEEEDSGLKLVKYIREELKNKEIRIVLRTGQPGEAPEKDVVINYDINDYAAKTEITTQRLFTTVVSCLRAYDDILQISKLNAELENKVKQRTCELEDANKKLKRMLDIFSKEQEAGRRLQFKFLPPRKRFIENFEFSRYLYPSMFLSGDFLNYFKIDYRHIGFYFADVSGHGLSSALVTVLLKIFIEKHLDEYIESNNTAILDPAFLLKKLNMELLRERIDKHLSIFFGLFDIEAHTLLISNGGHYPYPILYNNRAEFIRIKGLPVGIFEDAEYSNTIIPLQERFILLFVSDGILELFPDADDLISKEGHLLSLINDYSIDLDHIISNLNIPNFKKLPDDITLFMIKKYKK